MAFVLAKERTIGEDRNPQKSSEKFAAIVVARVPKTSRLENCEEGTKVLRIPLILPGGVTRPPSMTAYPGNLQSPIFHNALCFLNPNFICSDPFSTRLTVRHEKGKP